MLYCWNITFRYVKSFIISHLWKQQKQLGQGCPVSFWGSRTQTQQLPATWLIVTPKCVLTGGGGPYSLEFEENWKEEKWRGETCGYGRRRERRRRRETSFVSHNELTETKQPIKTEQNLCFSSVIIFRKTLFLKNFAPYLWTDTASELTTPSYSFDSCNMFLFL